MRESLTHPAPQAPGVRAGNAQGTPRGRWLYCSVLSICLAACAADLAPSDASPPAEEPDMGDCGDAGCVSTSQALKLNDNLNSFIPLPDLDPIIAPSYSCARRCVGNARCTTSCEESSGEWTTCGDFGYCNSSCWANDRNTPGNRNMGGRSKYSAVKVAPSLGSNMSSERHPDGEYRVTLYYHSPKRFAHKVSDHGHKESFCRRRDAHRSECLSGTSKIDGVRLKNDEHGHSSGMDYNWLSMGKGINGPRMKNASDEKREWDEHSDGDHCQAWTLKDDQLFRVHYDNVSWDGSAVSAGAWVKWKESDPGTWDDHSDPVYFDTGNAITACLQQARSQAQLTPEDDPYWFYVCDEKGGCSDPDHFKIRTYYSVSCRVESGSCERQGSLCGNGEECCNGCGPCVFACGTNNPVHLCQ